MPFGFGPRTCIGGTFAMMEGTAILATLVRRARFEWDGVHAPEPISRVTLQAQGRHAAEGVAARVDCATARGAGYTGGAAGVRPFACSVPAQDTVIARGLTPISEEPDMAIRSARNVEKQKKKNRRAMPRKKLTRIQGNTLAVRRRLKKMAGKARAAKAK